MTDKQARFCEEYMIDLNATQAAIRAGYSPKTAQEQSARLLSNVTIHFYVDVTNVQAFISIDAKNPEEGEYIIFYVLDAPIETPLTPAEIAAYKALTAYGPDTVVQASDGAGVKLEYQRDVNLVVKNLEDAIASMT